MICPECNSKFRLRDRIKSMIKKYGKIECSNCKSIFVAVVLVPSVMFLSQNWTSYEKID